MDLREFFKKIVREAKGPRHEATTIIRCGSHSDSWFKTTGKHPGQYAHLTDEYIDKMPLDMLQDAVLAFTMNCFRQI